MSATTIPTLAFTTQGDTSGLVVVTPQGEIRIAPTVSHYDCATVEDFAELDQSDRDFIIRETLEWEELHAHGPDPDDSCDVQALVDAEHAD